MSSEAINALHTISRLLNTGLDPTTLAACAGLIEKGVDPEALATIMLELRDEEAKLASRTSGP